MFDESIVPSITVCKWLNTNGWTAKTTHEWRKGSMSANPIVLQVPMHENLDVLIPFGTEEYRYAAPTARELFDALRTRVVVERQTDGSYRVSTEITPSQNVFQIRDKLEDALGDLWNELEYHGRL